jgi:hypothetical protein
MKFLNYRLADIPADDRNIFCDMLSYISPHIFSVKKGNEDVVLEIEPSEEIDILNKIDDLKKMLQSEEVKQRHEVTTKVIKDYTTNEVIHSNPIFDELIESGAVVPISEGIFAYGGLFLDVCKYFWRKIDEFGKTNFTDIIEYDVPGIYPIDRFEQGLYFESFPHHIMFPTTIKNDMNVLNEFSQNGTGNGEIFKKMNPPENVLRHAACVPIYPLLEGKNIDPDSPRIFLVSGKCFRNEGHNVFELARLKEFYMKEYVFVGTREQTHDYVEKARELWNYWIEKFGLNCKLETANDSFFASNYKKLKIFQILGDSKQEFKVWLPASKIYCAVSSSNIHRTHFTKAHDIKNGNAYCQSSCFAFGIERLSYALLSQKGLDVSKWDEQSRVEVFGA